MLTRSELLHTALDNGLGFLFQPNHRTGLKLVLTEAARPGEYSVIRERLEGWPDTWARVEENLAAFETDYAPFSQGLIALRERMPPNTWDRLAASHRSRVRDTCRVREFVAAVRVALQRFDDGLNDGRKGTRAIDEIGQLHAEILDAYRAF
jgi:hypothetical protein